jgi:hypothetical protein
VWTRSFSNELAAQTVTVGGLSTSPERFGARAWLFWSARSWRAPMRVANVMPTIRRFHSTSAGARGASTPEPCLTSASLGRKSCVLIARGVTRQGDRCPPDEAKVSLQRYRTAARAFCRAGTAALPLPIWRGAQLCASCIAASCSVGIVLRRRAASMRTSGAAMDRAP